MTTEPMDAERFERLWHRYPDDDPEVIAWERRIEARARGRMAALSLREWLHARTGELPGGAA